jgi:pimeloyl-ACP methyl ester carboxylesterase
VPLGQDNLRAGRLERILRRTHSEDPGVSRPSKEERMSTIRTTFSETDLTEDLKKFDVPTLIMHGDDDQIVPIADSAMLSSKLVKGATLKVYKGQPHGMCQTNKDQINADLLAFIKA